VQALVLNLAVAIAPLQVWLYLDGSACPVPDKRGGFSIAVAVGCSPSRCNN